MTDTTNTNNNRRFLLRRKVIRAANILDAGRRVVGRMISDDPEMQLYAPVLCTFHSYIDGRYGYYFWDPDGAFEPFVLTSGKDEEVLAGCPNMGMVLYDDHDAHAVSEFSSIPSMLATYYGEDNFTVTREPGQWLYHVKGDPMDVWYPIYRTGGVRTQVIWN